MTRYVILRKIEVGDSVDWRHEGTVAASGAPTALREHLRVNSANGDRSGGVFVAVPVRSFKPVAVTSETKTAFKFS